MRPIAGVPASAWHAPPAVLNGFEEGASQFLKIFHPLFDAGERDEGPRLPKAEIGFTAMLDYWMFCEARYGWSALRDMKAACRGEVPERIELVTDRWDGGLARRPTAALAKGWQVPFKTTYFAERTSLVNRIRRAVHRAADGIGPWGKSTLEMFENRTRRARDLASIQKTEAERLTIRELLHRAEHAKVRAAMAVYQPKSWRYLTPVYEELARQGHGAIFLSTRSTTEVPLRELGMPHVPNRHRWVPYRLTAEVREYFQQVPLEREAAVEMGEADLLPPLECLLRDAAERFVPFYADYAEMVPAEFRRFKINVVLGTDTGSAAGRALFRTAEKMGLASIFLQHGIFTELPGQAEYFTNCTKLVWGDSARDSLLNAKVPTAETIVSFGSPFLEEKFAAIESAAIPDAECSDVLVTYGIPSDICSEESFRIAVEEVVRAARALPERQFLVKLHPGDHSGLILGLAAQASLPNLRVTSEGDVYRMICGTKVLVTQYSTTGSEALFLGRPVVSVLLDGAVWNIDYLHDEAAYVLRQPDTLAPLVEEIIAAGPDGHRLAERQRIFAGRFLHRENRTCSARLVDYLEQAVEERVGQAS
jgi:hypothetical protein